MLMFTYDLSRGIIKIDNAIVQACKEEFGIEHLFECKLNIYLLFTLYFIVFPSFIILIIRNIIKGRKVETFIYTMFLLFFYFY